MILKRFAALALMAPLLHLNIVRADTACATNAADHSAHGAAVQQAADEHHTHDPETETAPTNSQERASCDTPAQADCCQALASCSLVLGADDDAVAARAALPHLGVLTAPADMPLSRVAAPEPPPPKV